MAVWANMTLKIWPERYWETDFELYIEVQLWATPPNLKA
jgi:hypothetical protein|tara:strand:- start:46160 stop:46276 length:117 start_codon:yes stop_codon:yes gene_type:complete